MFLLKKGITSAISKIRGFLSLFMIEISAGVFVGKINAKTRNNIWNVINRNISNGSATICYTNDGEVIIKKTGQERRRQIKNFEICLVGFEKLEENIE